MAMKQGKDIQPIIKCSTCGKIVPPCENGYVVDYCWHNGTIYCMDCLRGGATNGKMKAMVQEVSK